LTAIAVALLFFGLSGVSAVDGALPAALDEVPLRQYPLPASLSDLNGEHYGDRLYDTPVGALVWSSFPITVYLDANAPATWQTAMAEVVAEWGQYLPLRLSEASETANIVIRRQNPPPRRENGQIRAASARASYELYTDDENRLRHRFTILVSPTQVGQYAQSAVRHELGHALGIWGHSEAETDVMYYSQIRRPAAISPRDANTLRYVYEQPTRLGGTWNGDRTQH
jgi:predicted Zn-dependent protease